MYSRDGFLTETWAHTGFSSEQLWSETLVDFVPVEGLMTPNSRGKIPQPQRRMFRSLQMAVNLMTMRHFGIGDFPTTMSVTVSASQLAKKLFVEDWISEFETPATRFTRADLQREFNKQRKTDLTWFWAFFDSVFVCLIADRFETLLEVAEWVDPELKSEYMGGGDEIELSKLYVLIAHDIRQETVPRRGKIEGTIERSRQTRPKLLKATWDAVRAGDQTQFSKSFAAAVRDYGKKHNSKCMVHEAIAIHHSVVWMLAERQGLAFPTDLDDRHRAMIVTPESLKDDSPTSFIG